MADLQVRLYVCIGITWFAAFAALVLRVVARRMTRVILGPDDYFCLLAFVSELLCFRSSSCVGLTNGSYLHADIAPSYWLVSEPYQRCRIIAEQS